MARLQVAAGNHLQCVPAVAASQTPQVSPTLTRQTSRRTFVPGHVSEPPIQENHQPSSAFHHSKSSDLGVCSSIPPRSSDVVPWLDLRSTQIGLRPSRLFLAKSSALVKRGLCCRAFALGFAFARAFPFAACDCRLPDSWDLGFLKLSIESPLPKKPRQRDSSFMRRSPQSLMFSKPSLFGKMAKQIRRPQYSSFTACHHCDTSQHSARCAFRTFARPASLHNLRTLISTDRCNLTPCSCVSYSLLK